MESPREEALRTGKKTYFTGTPCKNGHVAKRNTKARSCMACTMASSAAAYAKRVASDTAYVIERRQKVATWKKANPALVRKYGQAWGKANIEKKRSYNREWRKRNPAKLRAVKQKWREQNRQKARQSVKDWEARNPARAALMRKCIKITRRAREANNGGRFTIADIEALYIKQDGRCAVCPCTEGLEIDHKLPVILGGSSDPLNLQLLCLPCNRKKGGKHPDVWRRELAAKKLHSQ